jgi:hypothetical protein
MARLTVIDDELHVDLSTREKLAGLLRDVRVPLTAVRDVAVEDNALSAVRGLRAPGLAIPGRAKIGTWRRPGRRGLVVARRGVPAVRVALSGARYDELLVSTPDAAGVADSLRRRACHPAREHERRR